MSRPPIPCSGLPGLEPLLGGPLWNCWAEQRQVFALDSVPEAVRYIRLKPETSCRLAVFNGAPPVAGDPDTGFLLHLFPDVQRARMAYSKLAGRPQLVSSAGYRPFLDQKHAVVAAPFPNDVELPSLRHFYRMSRLKEALHETLPDYPRDRWSIRKSKLRPVLLAYKPGRRAVFRVDVTLRKLERTEEARLSLHVKVEAPNSGGRGHSNLTAIHAAIPCDAGWGVPRPRGRVSARDLTVSEWIDGNPLDSRLSVSWTPDILRKVGRTLAGLHGLEAEVGPTTGPCGLEEQRRLGRDLVGLLPAERERLESLAERLARVATALAGDSRSVLIHGDFHMGQVLLRSGSAYLVDLDNSGSGPAAWDLGSFLAHLRDFAVRPAVTAAFVEGYREAGPAPIGSEQLLAAEALGLFRRVVLPFRRLARDWPQQTLRRLDRIEELLGRAGA